MRIGFLASLILSAAVAAVSGTANAAYRGSLGGYLTGSVKCPIEVGGVPNPDTNPVRERCTLVNVVYETYCINKPGNTVQGASATKDVVQQSSNVTGDDWLKSDKTKGTVTKTVTIEDGTIVVTVGCTSDQWHPILTGKILDVKYLVFYNDSDVLTYYAKIVNDSFVLMTQEPVCPDTDQNNCNPSNWTYYAQVRSLDGYTDVQSYSDRSGWTTEAQYRGLICTLDSSYNIFNPPPANTEFYCQSAGWYYKNEIISTCIGGQAVGDGVCQ